MLLRGPRVRVAVTSRLRPRAVGRMMGIFVPVLLSRRWTDHRLLIMGPLIYVYVRFARGARSEVVRLYHAVQVLLFASTLVGVSFRLRFLDG